MSWSRKRRYLTRWARYQKRCDKITTGSLDRWFFGHDFAGHWDAMWAVRRHYWINRGTSSRELATVAGNRRRR